MRERPDFLDVVLAAKRIENILRKGEAGEFSAALLQEPAEIALHEQAGELVASLDAAEEQADPVAALETLTDVWAELSGGSPHRAAAQQALELLAVIPPDERTRALHARLTAGFERLPDPEPR